MQIKPRETAEVVINLLEYAKIKENRDTIAKICLVIGVTFIGGYVVIKAWDYI